jgi:ABC-type uncharacterized transport system fused permease/ATPase subunit
MAVIPQISNNMGAAIALADRFAQVAGQIVRVAEFQEVLDELEEQQDKDAAFATLVKDLSPSAREAAANQEGGSILHGGAYSSSSEPKITLDDVTIVTPAGECIVSGLNAKVTDGNALMLTGRSAAGKSSVVRAIAGIWPIAGGRVEVYNTSDGHLPSLKDLFVVPQQLLMATGTLADQLTYPDCIPSDERSPELEQRLMSLLKIVGIDYLVERWKERDSVDESKTRRTGRQRGSEWDGMFAALEGQGAGWDRDVRWEDVLSLGEQQRMGIARMLYHKPRFAVLDECTSAVSVDAEEELYRAAMTSGTTCLTVSQRMTLPKFHVDEVKVGINEACGWSIEKIPEGQENQLMSGSLGDAMHATAELH